MPRTIRPARWQFSAIFAASVAALSATARADDPVAMYLFPAGGQRGTEVEVRVGGLHLHEGCPSELLGDAISLAAPFTKAETLWFEGPMILQPASQQQEDYPHELAGRIAIAADAAPGVRYWRGWTSQGAMPSLKFVVGDLPETVEQEIDGEPVSQHVAMPVTINGRIFPREDVDVWTFDAKAGQPVSAEVSSARLGYPLESRLEVLDPAGNIVADDTASRQGDAYVSFTPAVDGEYLVRVFDIKFGGLQHYVYRLTLSTGAKVERAYPLGARRGSTTQFELRGSGLPAQKVSLAMPGSATGMARQRVDSPETQGALWLELDDLPESLELEPNDAPPAPTAEPPPLAPVVFNGRIQAAGDVDWWRLRLPAQQELVFDVRASRLGSPLDAVLVLCDAAGQELARADDLADGLTDAQVRFAAPAEGDYLVRVEERFRSRGGDDFAYRLRVAPLPAPDYQLSFAADALTLPRGGQAKLKVRAERIGGFAGAISLAIDGLPANVAATGLEIPANAGEAELSLTAAPAAAIGGGRLTIRGSAELNGAKVDRVAAWSAADPASPVASVLLAVALPTPFKVVGTYEFVYAARGTTLTRRYRLERGGFDGPLEVRLSEKQTRHLQGVTGPTTIVPPDATEFDYTAYLPPWMELGRTSRTCIMATGVITEPDGVRHKVSFTSVAQNEQIVGLVSSGLLSVKVNPSSCLGAPDSRVAVEVLLARDPSLTGPVQVELATPRHLKGVAADEIEIPAGESRGVLTLRFDRLPGPFNMPVTIRATTMQNGKPHLAEAPLDIEAAAAAGKP